MSDRLALPSRDKAMTDRVDNIDKDDRYGQSCARALPMLAYSGEEQSRRHANQFFSVSSHPLNIAAATR